MRVALFILPLLAAGCVVEGASSTSESDTGTAETDTDTDTDTDSDVDSDADADTDADSDADSDADTDADTDTDTGPRYWVGSRTFSFSGVDCSNTNDTLDEEGPELFFGAVGAFELTVTPGTVCGYTATTTVYRTLEPLAGNEVNILGWTFDQNTQQWSTYDLAVATPSGAGWSYSYGGSVGNGVTYSVEGYFELQ